MSDIRANSSSSSKAPSIEVGSVATGQLEHCKDNKDPAGISPKFDSLYPLVSGDEEYVF